MDKNYGKSMQNKGKFIYFCYSKKDGRSASNVIKALKEDGFEVFLSSNPQNSADWASEAQDLIENCSIFMPFVTENFIEDDRCRKEVCLADANKKTMVTLFMKQTPLKYGMALMLTSEQGIERWMHKDINSFLKSLTNSPVLQNLINSSSEKVTKGVFASYLLYAVNQGKISVNRLIERFLINEEKAKNIVDYMIACGFCSKPKKGGVCDVWLTEFGFETLYFKSKKQIMLSQIKKDTPYAFISYAHRNSEKVLPLINLLQGDFIRIWFDEGIEVGAEWPATIQQRINECEIFIPIITPEFVESKNCRKEVYLADKSNKNMIPIHLEECELKYGLDLQLAGYTEYHKKDYAFDYAFENDLLNNPSLNGIKVDESNIIEYDYFIKCIEFLIERDTISISAIQRTFCMGFNRVSRLVLGILDAGLAYRLESRIIRPYVTKQGIDFFAQKEDLDVLF